MPNPVCSNVTWITNATCYTQQSLNYKKQKALLIYAKALELAALGGTNYLTSLATTLLTDATQTVCAITADQRTAARINIAFVNAAASGATVPATLALKMIQVACLSEADDVVLDKALLLLQCRLGQHEAYPQT